MDTISLEETSQEQARPEKVVYVLGAGFSKPAGAPNQAEILGEIFKLCDTDDHVIFAKAALREFLENDLSVCIENVEQVALEDIYTPMDRCIADGTSLKTKTALELSKIREDLQYLISTVITRRIASNLETDWDSDYYIKKFARYIVNKVSRRAELAVDAESAMLAKQYDPLSIISLNWDILLDNALHMALYEDSDQMGDYDPFGVVDYCCYVSSVDAGDHRVRSGLWSLGCRGYNVKLLKLHGSMNWLQCPNCQRLFVQFGSKETIQNYVGNLPCRHCKRFGYKNRLVGSLVMPTFLKDLSNFQIKLVWQNASVEIMEAERLVFIGYSLPHADFEFRQLISRMIRRDATIEVVLFEGDLEESKQRYREEVSRYRQFFGNRRLEFNPSGVKSYVDALVDPPRVPNGY